MFDCHLFISKMCALRYRGRRASRDRSSTSATGWHICRSTSRAFARWRRHARRQNGSSASTPDRPVVGRIGRADDHKWRRILVDMIPELRGARPTTPRCSSWARRRRCGAGSRRGTCWITVRLVDPVVSESELATYYAACDVVVHASSIGESQGVVLAEAMALGLPVVTNPTPWTDNAQIELVEEGVTGHVAAHPRAVRGSRRVAAARRGRAERAWEPRRAARADEAWDVRRQADRLRELSRSLARGRLTAAGVVADARGGGRVRGRVRAPARAHSSARSRGASESSARCATGSSGSTGPRTRWASAEGKT